VNLALPALVLLLGILPGIACFYGYFAGRFDKRAAGLSGVEELALYVIFAIPIDAVALIVCRRLGVGFEFGVATRLVAGSLSENATADVAAVLQRSATTTSITYVAILACSYVLGSLARRFVWTCRLDVYMPPLRLRHSWFYVLQGRLPAMPRVVLAYVDVLTEHPGESPDDSRLYRGLVVDFDISSTGGIDSLTLRDSKRGRGRGEEFEWANIPSTRLMIVGSTIHSINITYFELVEPLPSAVFARLRHDVRIALRRFFLEEP
jgi:hypothetical protein